MSIFECTSTVRENIHYKSWMDGTWKVESTTTDVYAPCGPLLFGGNATFNRAKIEIGTSLNYKARFIPGDGTSSST